MDVPQLIADRYRIDDARASLLGSGGMGTVYRGIDTVTGDRVAIKQLRSEIIAKTPDILVRFQREGEVLRKLQHPNIIAGLDAVEHDDRHYLIMEYVPGGSLRDLMLELDPIPLERTLSIALELADALSRAHHLDVIHRDIKPDNVLIADDGTPRLTDFGVARIGDSTRMTQDGTVVGTVSYLAPEGFSGEIDARSDIWALGVMLFEMLTGTHPFEVDSVARTITAVLTLPPRDMTQLSPHLPPTIVDLVGSMLQKNPADRISSMRLVAAQLEAIIAGKQTLPVNTPTPKPFAVSAAMASRIAAFLDADPKTTPDDLRTAPTAILAGSPKHLAAQETTKTKDRLPKRFILGVSAVLLIAVVVIIAALLLSGESEPDVVFACDVPEGKYMVIVADLEPLDTTRTNPARFIVDDLHRHLEVELPYSELAICHYPAVITSSDEALVLAEAHQALVVVWGNYTETIADVQLNVGYPPGFVYSNMERDLLETITNVRLRIVDPTTETSALQVLGALVTLQNDNGDGYKAARTITISSLIDSTPAQVVGNSTGAYSTRYFSNFTRDDALALDMVTQALNTSRNHISYSSRAGLLLRLGDLDEARRDSQTALRLGPEGYALPYYILANIEMAEGNFEAAIDYYTTILEIRPDDWFAFNYRGAIHYLIGDNQRAREDLERAIALGPDANFPYMLLLMLSIREGDLLVAQETMETVFREYPDPRFGSLIVSTTFGDDFPVFFAPVFSAFGNLTLGQYALMLEDIEQAIAIEPNLSDLYMMRGYAYCNLDDHEAAEEAYTQALALDPEFTALYVFRAESRRNTGNLLEAALDVGMALSNDPDGIWAPIVAAAQDGSLNCKNLLTYDLAGLYQAASDE